MAHSCSKETIIVTCKEELGNSVALNRDKGLNQMYVCAVLPACERVVGSLESAMGLCHIKSSPDYPNQGRLHLSPGPDHENVSNL
jgi:hypothetical protein